MCDIDFYNALEETREAVVRKEAELQALYDKEYAKHMSPPAQTTKYNYSVETDDIIDARLDVIEAKVDRLLDMVEHISNEYSNKLFAYLDGDRVTLSKEQFNDLLHKK